MEDDEADADWEPQARRGRGRSRVRGRGRGLGRGQGGTKKVILGAGNNSSESLASSTAPSNSTVASSKTSCPRCDKDFRSMDGYRSHMKGHLLHDLFASAPGQEAFCQEGRRLARETISAILNIVEKHSAALSKEGAPFINELLSRPDEELFVFIDAVSLALWSCAPEPTAKIEEFNFQFLKAVNKLLCNDEERHVMTDILKKLVENEYSSKLLQWFLESFVRELSKGSRAFYLRCMREPRELFLFGEVGAAKKTNRDDVDDSDFQQSVYYVGGSVIRSVLGVSCRSLKTPQWVRIDKFIRERVLVGEMAKAPDEAITEWTKNIDRGGLKHLSEPMWTFLMSLSCILKKVKQKDGSVRHATVWSEVEADDGVLFLWFEVVQSHLSEEDSKFLLKHVCTRFVNTWGAGVALRHRNAISERLRDRIALRASLISRK